jgi:hypothetical protein
MSFSVLRKLVNFFVWIFLSSSIDPHHFSLGVYIHSCIFRDKCFILLGSRNTFRLTWLRVCWCTGTARTALPFCLTWVQNHAFTLCDAHRQRENENDVQIFPFFSLLLPSNTNAEQKIKSTFWEFTGSIYLHSHSPQKQACFPDHKVFSLKKITDQILSLTTNVILRNFLL